MHEKNKEDLGLEIHDRIIKSIKKENRKRNRKNFSMLSILVLILLCGSFYFSYREDILSFVQKNNGREITADFLTGTITEKEASKSTTENLQIGKDNTQAIYRDEKDNKMVLNVAKLDLADDDVLNIKTGIGGFYRVELPDGSIVNLNANSNLHYTASYLKDRKLTLSGEAYFEVKKLLAAKKIVPFEVKTNQQSIKVLGTEFNVKTSGEFDETLLFEGKLSVKGVNSGKENLLAPGDLIRVGSNGSVVKELSEGEIEELLAWKEGFLYYENRSLAHILSDLQKYYDFDFDKKQVPKENFTIYLARENNLNELIAMLDASSLAGLKLNNKSLIFSK